MINQDKHTDRTRRVLFLAATTPPLDGGSQVKALDLLDALLLEGESIAAQTLSEVGLRNSNLIADDMSGMSSYSDQVVSVMDEAANLSDERLETHIAPEHILLALLKEQDCKDALYFIGVTSLDIQNKLSEKISISNSLGRDKRISLKTIFTALSKRNK